VDIKNTTKSMVLPSIRKYVVRILRIIKRRPTAPFAPGRAGISACRCGCWPWSLRPASGS